MDILKSGTIILVGTGKEGRILLFETADACDNEYGHMKSKRRNNNG